MSTTEAPAVTRPDLAPLLESDPETVAHLILTEAGGATWRSEAGGWVCWLPMEPRAAVSVCRWPDGGVLRVSSSLPRPLHDDGDAWRLASREGLYVDHRHAEASAALEGPWATAENDARRSVVLAALDKHSDDPRWSTLIPSVIERLGVP